MLNQKLTDVFEAPEPPLAMSENTAPAPFTAAPGLVQRAAQYNRDTRSLALIPAEYTSMHLIDLPKVSARKKEAMIRFAVEDLIATPLDTVVVSQAPSSPQAPQLALVTAAAILARSSADGRRAFPECLLIAAPATSNTWAVWSENARAVVRTADGTGFAASIDMLQVLWRAAGQPAITTLADPLPEVFAASTTKPIPPAATDLAFRFAQDAARETGSKLRIMAFAACTILIAGVGLLAVRAVDTLAYQHRADTERSAAQRAIAVTLPGIDVSSDVTPILARLAPKPTAPARDGFLPLLSDITAQLSATPTNTNTPITFRRLAWGAQDNRLVVLVQAAGLEDLQQAQQQLESAGFDITAGAANAGDGGAEVEFRIARHSAQ